MRTRRFDLGGELEQRLLVCGQTFAVRRRPDGVLDVEWATGANPGYGFSVSLPGEGEPRRHLRSGEEAFVRARIEEFLAAVDPQTGFIG